MIKRICWFYLFFVISLGFSASAIACVSPELQERMQAILGVGSSVILNSTRHVERVGLDGRRVLQMRDLNIGRPTNVNMNAIRSERKKSILENGGTNLDLMKEGLAPIGPDGLTIELHHIFGEEPGPIAELTASVHRRESKDLHSIIDGSFRKDPEKRKNWNSFKGTYWESRAKEFY